MKLVVIVIAATVSTVSYAAAQDAHATSQALAAAKDGTVEQFASALAAAKRPVGVVLLRKDVQARIRPLKVEDEVAATTEATITAFRTRYPEYRLERTADVAVIRPAMGSWCNRLLQSPLKSLTANGEAFEVLYRVMRALTNDAAPDVPPGIVGREDHRPDTYRMPVIVNLIHSSFENALNEVVRQAPGLGWAVREVNLASPQPKGDTVAATSVTQGCNLALFDGVGWLETSWTAVGTSRE